MNIELFSCAAGMAEGFRRAGIGFDFAFDFAKDHCASYKANIGHMPVCMDVRDILRLARAGIISGPVDLLVADPPCTPWSRAGLRKGTGDERDMLEDTCELIRILRPRAYLIGNVPGLDDSKNWPVVQRVIGGLQRFGYCVADFAALDAADYGVPQHRVRPFWFGHLEGPCIVWPMPTHCDPDDLTSETLPGFERLRPWITCRQALGHLPPDELGRPVKLRKRNQNSKQHGSIRDRPARVVGTSNLSDGNVLLLPTADLKAILDARTRTCARSHCVTPDCTCVACTPGGARRPGRAPACTCALEDGVMYSERHPPNDPDRPSQTLGARQRGNGPNSMRRLSRHDNPERGNNPDAPARAVTTQTQWGNGALVARSKHPPLSMDRPATTVRGGGDGHAPPALVLTYDQHHPPHDLDKPANVIRASSGGGATRAARDRHPPSDADAPARTVRASDGGGSKRQMRNRDIGRPGQGMRVGKPDKVSATITAKAARVGAGESHVIEWPWDVPATTVQADNRIAPPGHHDDAFNGGLLSQDGAIVLSEKAAIILQGFPEDWQIIGKTQKARWSQIGQAMPPPLSHAVASSVKKQLDATADLTRTEPSLATGKLTVV